MHALRFLVLLASLAISAAAGAARPPEESWTVTLRFENDLFADTDRFYTNGLKLSWISPDLNWFQDLEWFQRDTPLSRLGNEVIDLLPWSGDETRQRNIALSIGQMMFTPEDISRHELIPDDRPYAGWLYGSVAFHSKSFRELDTFEIQAGLTGPWSLAQEAQELVHGIRGIDKARGWDNQIDTELAGALVYEHKYRVITYLPVTQGLGIDAIGHLGGALGTVFTYAGAGLEVRAGWNLPADFGSALIRPAGETDAPADSADPRYDPEGTGFSFHVFAAAAGRAVLHDIFLDGNTFSHSHSVDKKLVVADLVLGAAFTYGRFKLTYAHVLRTPEFKGQDGSQQFGSVSLSFTY